MGWARNWHGVLPPRRRLDTGCPTQPADGRIGLDLEGIVHIVAHIQKHLLDDGKDRMREGREGLNEKETPTDDNITIGM
jgi:hypothetical protein